MINCVNKRSNYAAINIIALDCRDFMS
ncbi:hypothetical protein A2U01_0081941, partial [Trifolium medium]|nr:hypothetical protein [Trifolium medium]